MFCFGFCPKRVDDQGETGGRLLLDGVCPRSKSQSNIWHVFSSPWAGCCVLVAWLAFSLDFHLFHVLCLVLMVNRACTVN